MKKMPLNLLFPAVFFAAGVFVVTSQTFADSKGRGKREHGNWDHSKQEQVYQQRRSRGILPFEDILKSVRPFIVGEIIETEFEIEHGIPTYEFKYIDRSGRVREMYVNAKTGKIIKDDLD